MAIDTSIYNNVRPFTMADPYESAGKALALRAMQKKYTIEDDIAQAGAESGGDPERMAQSLLAKGHYEPALQLRQQAASLRKEQAGVLQAEQSRFASLLPVLRNELARVGDDAGLAQLRMKTATLAQGFTSPQFQQMLTSMAQEIPAKFDPNWQQQQLMTADDLLKRLAPNVTLANAGDKLVPYNTNPNAPGGLGPVAGAPEVSLPASDPLSRLIAARDRLPAGHPDRAKFEKAITEYKPGGTTVNVNEKAPAGYRWTATGDLEPIPGGPATKLGEGQVKQEVGVRNTRNAIKVYRDALKNWGGVDILNPSARARMGTIYNNMLLQAKEAYNLGVLNGPDYQILQEVITHPASAQGFITSKKALDEQAAKLDEIMERVGKTVTSPTKHGDQPEPSPAAPKGKVKFLGFE
jgi:hypothetical protein